MKSLLVIGIGVTGVLLGGLWLLQGLGVVHIPPILCFANCEPVQGPSLLWTLSGLSFVAAGCIAVAYAVKHRTQRPR